MEVAVSFDVEPGFTEQLAKLAADIGAELVTGFLHGHASDLITPADRPVVGTKHAVMRLRLSSELLDQELRAALRAKGFDVAAGAHRAVAPD